MVGVPNRWRAHRHRKVRFHAIDAQGRSHTFEGVLAAVTKEDYILWAPRMITGEEETQTLSGHLELPKSNVLFKQIL